MNTNEHNNSVLTIQSDKNSKKKFKEWENILVGKDIHSIRNQIYNMIWDSAVFQCINESRKYSATDNNGKIKQNKMLHYFINQSFFKTQLLLIRRLVDKDFGRVIKGKQYTVYSLYNLIKDLKKNNALLTRVNILAVRDLPYDYEKEMAEFDNDSDYTEGPVIVPRRICLSKDIHLRIDSLIGKSSDNRSPDDLIPLNIINQLEIKMENVEKLCKYVDKYIAHAATPDSRVIVPEEIEGALGKILNAQKIICETARLIGNNLLFCGFGEVLSISQYGQFDQYDLFEYLDEPIASKETIEKLREFWEKYRRETAHWNT